MNSQRNLSVFCLILLLFAGCGHQAAPNNAPQPPTVTPTPSAAALFEEVALKSGLNFTQLNGADSTKPLFVQTTPAGCAWIDYDNDGWEDAILVQSGSADNVAGYVRPHCAIFHNNGNGTFTDVTAGSGLDKDLGYAHGIAVGDFDNDGYDDFFITSLSGNKLFHNERGTGKFTDVTAKWGLDKLHSTGYATSAAFGDYDNDGKLDLYVCYYCPWTLPTNIRCNDAKGGVDYCSPEVYPMDVHQLFHNDGNHFTDVSEKSGIAKVKGRGLAVAFVDYDEDGKQDIYVANDLSGNMLWHNEGKGKFVEKAGETGVRYGENGVLMAGMGVSVGDYDQSGHESLLVSNFQDMPNMLFHNLGKGILEDVATSSRVGPAHLPYLTFGLDFFDYDADGWLDFMTANGHVQFKGKGVDNLKQPKQLMHNLGNGSFAEVTDAGALGPLKDGTVARGIAISDFDNDGRLDALVSNQNSPSQLFRNLDNSKHHWVSFKTIGVKSNRDGIGAKFEVVVGGKKRVAAVRISSSFLSSSDRRLYFGLGDATSIDSITITWPSGLKQTLASVVPDKSYIVTEGKGITGEAPTKPRSGTVEGKAH